MAKISTYPFPSPPSASDYVIGTDTNDALATKNFMISDILALGGTSYVPYTGAIQDVDLGSYSLYTYSLYMQGGPIYDGNGSPGSSGEILSSQGPGNSPVWVDLSTLATAYVPYTGASQDVDLGSFSLFTYGIVLQGGTIVDGNDSEGTLGQVLTSQGPGNMPLWQGLPSFQKDYGSFYDNTTQSFSANTPKAVSFSNVYFQSGVSIVSDGTSLTRITFSKTGKYSLSFIPAIFNSAGSPHTCQFWLRKNGNATINDIPFTMYNVTTGQNNAFSTKELNYFVDVNAGDYIHLIFNTPSISVGLYTSFIASFPLGPSIVANINEI